MAEIVTTSLVIGFDKGTDDSNANSFFVEIDDRDDGPNKGKTSFKPGDDVYLLLFKPSNCILKQWVSTAGTLSRVATNESKTIEDDLLSFESINEVTVRYPIPLSGAYTLEWLGNNLGSTVRVDDVTIRLSTPESTLGDFYYGLALIDYVSPAESWVLSNTLLLDADNKERESYSILVAFQGEVP